MKTVPLDSALRVLHKAFNKGRQKVTGTPPSLEPPRRFLEVVQALTDAWVRSGELSRETVLGFVQVAYAEGQGLEIRGRTNMLQARVDWRE